MKKTKDPFRFYVYAYLRDKDSATAKIRTPYYIGKGTVTCNRKRKTELELLTGITQTTTPTTTPTTTSLLKRTTRSGGKKTVQNKTKQNKTKQKIKNKQYKNYDPK